MMGREWVLGIEISNPSSGARGRMGEHIAGPSVALGRILPGVSHPRIDPGCDEAVGGGDRHDDDLMPAIDRLCRRVGVAPGDLARVALSIGPGGYTSLRIAVATGKMIAEATGAQVVAVPSAIIAAWYVEQTTPAVVCLASKGETSHATLLPPMDDHPWWASRGRWSRLLSERDLLELAQNADELINGTAAAVAVGVIGAEELECLAPALVIADAYLPPAMRASAERMGARVVEPIFTAAAVAHLGMAFPPVDPVALAPVYPREPDAVTQWRKRRGG